MKDVFLDSDTAMAVLSHVLLHGRVLPNVEGELERMDEQAALFPVAAFKTYTQFGPGIRTSSPTARAPAASSWRCVGWNKETPEPVAG